MAAHSTKGKPGASKAAKWAGRWSNLSTDHIERWKKRLYVPTSGRNGASVEAKRLAVRIQHLGRREEFRFETTNRQAAAVQALGVFRFLTANGWDATLAKHKPEPAILTKTDVTLGDYLAAVADSGHLRQRTFLLYQNCLRTIAAEVFGVKQERGTSKFDYRSKNGGRAKWIAKIDSHRLEELTADRVNLWKRARILRAGHAPNAVASARRTINSYIRCARSLFASALVEGIKGLSLPTPLPFAGVKLEESGSMKYVSKLNPQALIAAARAELKEADPEAYKAFLLGLFAGLRKSEIDSLEWRMVDFANASIRVENTEWLHLKTADSAAVVSVDAEVITELKALLPTPTAEPSPWSQFILRSQRPPRPDSPRQYYRCAETFDRLGAWLKGKGVTASKPIHELRKELGALIASQHGIFAASRFLRHSDISTTARHYADKKDRISTGLGAFLKTEPGIANTLTISAT